MQILYKNLSVLINPFLLEYFSFFRTKQGKRIWSLPEKRLHKHIASSYLFHLYEVHAWTYK